jgi:hypothetical protein
MADTTKVLAQTNPSATTLTDSYTVPASTATVISSVVICNQAAVAASFRVSVAIAGAGDTAKQYLYYDESLAANDTFIATIGITLAATDVVRVYASNATMSFNLFGLERT